MNESRALRRMRRAGNATAVLDVAALACMVLAVVFLKNVQYRLFDPPPAILSFHTAIALLLALALTIVIPALVSALIPSTPAGQLLQRTKWKTGGFVAGSAFAVFLSYYAFTLLLSWWSAQRLVAESG